MSERKTLGDVARECGVSLSTVSRVLNCADATIDISEATALRVRDAAARIGYVPSAAARALRTGRTRTLGVLGTGPAFFGDVRASFVGQILSGLVAAAAAEGYHLTLVTGFAPGPGENGVMADLGMSDGLIVLNRDLAHDPPAVRAALGAWTRPLVYMLEYPEDAAEAALAVAPDDEQGGRLAADVLLDAGRARHVFLNRAYFPGIFGRRERGWRTRLTERIGGEGEAAPVRDAATLTPDALRALVASGVNGAVCANTSVAAEILRLAREAGVRVPEELALVRFGHDEPEPDAAFAEVTHDLAGEAAEAVRLLVARVEGREVAPGVRPFPYRARPGASLPPPPPLA